MRIDLAQDSQERRAAAGLMVWVVPGTPLSREERQRHECLTYIRNPWLHTKGFQRLVRNQGYCRSSVHSLVRLSHS